MSFFGNTNTTAQSANAKCKRQNAKLGDGANEEQTVGDDVLGVPNCEKRKKYGSNEVQTVGTGVLDCPEKAIYIAKQ